jgi:hypothetical protein
MESVVRPKPIIVTLIHGTFDRRARWTETDSAICKKIMQEIGRNVYITRFNWSGNNSEEDRRDAARRLMGYIATQSLYCSCPHFLVGHSHGGNILRWSLDLASFQELKNVAGAVSVSTPFIEVTPRAFVNGIHLLFLIWRLALALTLGLGWLALLAAQYETIGGFFLPILWRMVGPVTGGVVLLAWIPLIVLNAAIKKFAQAAETRLLISLESRQQRILTGNKWRVGYIIPLETPPASLSELKQPFLCTYTKRDEVNFLFGGARRLVWLSRLIESSISISENTYGQSADTLEFIQLLLWLAIGVATLPVLIGNLAGRGVSEYLVFHYGLPLAVIGFILSVAIPLAMSVGILLYGTAAALDLLVVNFHTTMTPANVRNMKVSIVSPFVANIEGVSGNVHTGILYGEEVASIIATFLKENLATHSL